MFKIKNEAECAVIYIYGTIGADFWNDDDSNTAKDFAKKLDELEPKPLNIRIDSGGGDVYEGFAIASAIQRYEGHTHVFIDGMAASAASYIALMADEVSMNDFSMIMIHNAWTFAVGNRDELRDTAARLEALDDTIAGIISSRSGLSIEETRGAMCAETWYTADEAREAGMCDEVIETEQRIAASIDQRLLCHFKNVPENIAVDMPVTDDVIVKLEKAIDASDESENNESDLAGGEKSHAEDTVPRDEAEDTAEVIVLGNKVYRKEQKHE